MSEQREHMFSEGQRAVMEQMMFRVGDIIADRLQKNFDDRIRLHHNECGLARSKSKAEIAVEWGGRIWILIVSIAVAMIGFAQAMAMRDP